MGRAVHPSGKTKIQLMIDAIRDAGSQGISFVDLCMVAYGHMASSARSEVSDVTKTLEYAEVVEVLEGAAGHHDLWYVWIGN